VRAGNRTGMAPALTIREFTDPACPFAFSAEPARLRLTWLYGDQIEWQPRMVVLSESPDDYLAKGFTPERQSEALETIRDKYGMPIDTGMRPRMLATVHACRAVVAARLHAEPGQDRALLRRLRIRAMGGDMIDEPGVIALCAREAGIEPMMVFRAAQDDPAVEAALRDDMAAARAPSAASLALSHKLAAADWGMRYTCPSYEMSRIGGDWPRFDVPGFQPVEVYEAAIANLAPELERRPAAESVEDVLAWAGEPLAAAEVAAICEMELDEADAELARVAIERDGWWWLPASAEKIAA
jgi:predicted DsbA family dithiol-disulfide isomerase